ncbi:MAG TPA: amino acid adenylation domain-containing protein [Terriglobales bacterium]|nr:amino acid adenylation domain-containing protein [Terriglobales bacterium]
MKIAIAATFTAEPLQDALAFWAGKLQWHADIAFASYNQVFQELLDPASLLSRNKSGFNLILVRPEDWQEREIVSSPGQICDSAKEFVRAVQAASRRSVVPCLICLCPASPAKAANLHVKAAEKVISDELDHCPGVHLIRSAEVSALYPVTEYYDAERDELGRVPYTSDFFAALGTALVRRMYALKRDAYKVIVADCDETLWKGVCAEVGPQGVEIDPGCRALQEFLVAQQAAGMLLCLCSKNVESDIDEVFHCQPMPLKSEHIIARRVNWLPKPQNLRELAAELQLGLDTFIFIDDSPLECEQLRSACPEVLTLQLPASDDIPHFLRNVWPFDKHEFTEEDRRRTALYRENQERDRFRQQVPTLESFLAALRLEVEITQPAPEQMARVSQLSQRTNQFNFTRVRRTEAQITQLLQSDEWECLSVHVKDRFGDYGLVGALMFRVGSDALQVDTFLLSCRVLGRGVEHAMLRRLGEIALSRGLSRVDLEFVPSKRNAPALAFLESLVAEFKESAETGFVYRVPAHFAAEISQSKLLATSQAAAVAVREEDGKSPDKAALPAESELIQEIAAEFRDVASILAGIHGYKGLSNELSTQIRQQQNSELRMVIDSWSEVLWQSEIHPNDDFFALGGDSLLATQIISRLRQVSGVRLHLSDLFDNPTAEQLARVIQENKKENTAQAKEGSVLAQRSRAIPRRAGSEPCALSFSQQRWWFLNQWAPGTADHLSLILRLKGTLKRKALELSLKRLIERHEILRTTYRLVDDSPVQVVSPTIEVPLSFASFSELPQPQRDSEAQKFLDQQLRHPFDLSNEPPLRATLLQYAPEDHALLLVMHHIASDGWSRGILLRELEAAYQAYAAGQEPAFADVHVQYSDFSVWQRGQFANGELEEQLSYWKERLAAAPALLQLPTDHPRPTIPSLQEGVHTRVLPQNVVSYIQALGQAEGTTLFMTLLAGFQALLYRYSGQEDIVVGAPVAGRDHPDLDGVIGCFINMVPFRSQVDGNSTFRKFLAQVRQTALEAEERQDVPFEKLVEELEGARDMGRAPIFQAVLALENLLRAPQLPGLDVQLHEVETRSAFHDLSLFAAQQSDGLRLRFEYRTDLFTSGAIERMADHFTNMLAAIVADPDRTINSLPMLTQEERQQLLQSWNEQREYPVQRCVHQLFEEQAARVPGNTALVFESQRMTYAELNARSNQLACYLRRVGVGPDVLVGLLMQRSLDLVISILAILKAGGAYLPLDPSYPKERLAFMIEDARPPVVITQYDLKENLPNINGQVLALDAEWPEIERESAAKLVCAARPENLAYVIYTSGSTGRPKGCQITHANVVRLFVATQDWFQFDEHDVWTMFHSCAFDFSVWELWGALIYGGKLVIVPSLVSRSPEDFYQLLEEEKVTVLNQTPSSFRQLIRVEENTVGASRLQLRYVIFGGEALDVQSLKPWFARHGDKKPRLINMYGITETTVHVTYRPLSLQDTLAGSVIGRPIPDLQLYLLDRNREPVPIGVAGEIYVGGAGVARGYLNRPELNHERFIPDVFHPGDNRRLYKSGDQARRLANGDIEYLGRIDQQVKIRGFRIELGEIESVLATHAAVREAVVQLDNGADGDCRLIAYLVPQNGQVPQQRELHAFLKERLPEYMIPAAFMTIDRMPLTSNGKIDRQALPRAEFAVAERVGAFAEPRTPLEREVAASWKEVLGVERVGIHENFFEIGGHSLLATRVIISLRAKLGLNFSLRLLFENPTIAGMAWALMEPLVHQIGEDQAVRIVEEVEAVSDEAAREQRAKQAAATANSTTEFLTGTRP